MSTLNALVAGYMTSGTWWIIPQTAITAPVDPMVLSALEMKLLALGITPKPVNNLYLMPGLQAFRASCLTNGRFRMARGAQPSFDPATALYATSDTVANLAAVNGIAILGDVASASRLLKHSHAWKQWMSLDQALAHRHLGKTMPSKAIILAAYADDEDIEA
ncbi:MAG TPA: hypothetical protein VM075_08045 [Anaerolineae bacterium]|nr:hypothetical protein [Anaerolineae bacterium]